MTARKAARTKRSSNRLRPRVRPAALRTRVFVYGTLLAGERNHHLLEGALLVAEAKTGAGFTLYDFGPYPGMVACGDHAVLGEVYEVDEPALARMDRLEGHPRFYRRTSIRLDDGSTVEAYLLRLEQVRQLPIIPSASWRTRHEGTPP
jgi:gamma-glutamylaminecyclotransferase